MILRKITRKQWIGISIALLFIITNPSLKSFNDYNGFKANGARRTVNAFLLSVYYYDGHHYIGVLENFIDITKPKSQSVSMQENKSNSNPFKEFGGDVVDSTAYDTSVNLPLPPPKFDKDGNRIKYDTVGFDHGYPILRKHNTDPLDILKKR